MKRIPKIKPATIERFWINHPEWDRALLGKIPDRELGELWGITRERVRQLREREGIPAWFNTTRHEEAIQRMKRAKRRANP